jgi:hypothetical protein
VQLPTPLLLELRSRNCLLRKFIATAYWEILSDIFTDGKCELKIHAANFVSVSESDYRRIALFRPIHSLPRGTELWA